MSTEQAKFFINKIFDEKFYKVEIVNLCEILHNLIQLLDVYKTERRFIFEKIILYIHCLNQQNEYFMLVFKCAWV